MGARGQREKQREGEIKIRGIRYYVEPTKRDPWRPYGPRFHLTNGFTLPMGGWPGGKGGRPLTKRWGSACRYGCDTNKSKREGLGRAEYECHPTVKIKGSSSRVERIKGSRGTKLTIKVLPRGAGGTGRKRHGGNRIKV